MLRHVNRLASRYPQVQEQVTYLQKRRELMDHPSYRALGWPIGSGSVESSHKLVIQARLKGPGMHWKPEHVNPMLAVRLALLNEHWLESWQQQQLKRQARQQQRLREQQAKRQEARQKTGRTEAQYRWGRQTFSPRLLQQADGAKNETHLDMFRRVYPFTG